jgi:hypothetical protein
MLQKQQRPLAEPSRAWGSTHDLVARQDLLGDYGRQAAQHVPAGVDNHLRRSVARS